MSTHTPGPWAVHLDGVLVLSALTKGRRSAIVDCETSSAPGMPQKEREANARLIATAPDGLALARLIVEYFGDDPIDPILDADINLRDRARAIVANATAVRRAFMTPAQRRRRRRVVSGAERRGSTQRERDSS